MKTTRRKFFKNSALAVAGLNLNSLIIPNTRPGGMYSSPSDQLNLGVIGVGMGAGDLNLAMNNSWVHCIAMCDVNKERLDQQASSFKKNFPNQTSKLNLYTDFRKLLENKDIDGVIIAPPDHWHAYIFAEALKVGKAVYVEKPVANTIEECNIMMDLQKKYKTVVTCGLWQTSLKYFIGANEILKTGVLGDVYKVQLWLSSSTNPRPASPDSVSPETLDWEMWLGPAPQKPYNSNRHRNWRSFWDYGGGQQTDWGVHWIDSAFDGLKVLGLNDRKLPKSVFSVGYKHPRTSNDTPSCQTTVFQFDNFHIEWSQQVANLYNRNQGVAWIGSKATLVCNRSGYELYPEKERNGSPLVAPIQMTGIAEEGGILNHTLDWCNAIRNNSIETKCPLEKGAFATILAHLANISHRSGAKVEYDPKTRRIKDNPIADAFIKANYRSPWKLPLA